MKRLIYLSMAALLVFCVNSCKKDNPTPAPGRIILTPENPIVIDWDYRFYDNIKDLYVTNIHVDGDRNNLIPFTGQGTWNAKTGFIYTEGTGAVTKHTNYEHSIDVNLISSAEYGVKDSTYVFSIRKWNEEEGITYFGEFNYVVKARPADALIELGPFESSTSKESIQIPVLPIQAAYSFHKQYYSDYTFEQVAADFAHDAREEYVKVTVDGKFVVVPVWSSFNFYGGKEKSYLSILFDRPGEWKVYVYTHFANVGYNFVFTINVK